MCAVVGVAVDNAALNFDRLYSYEVPKELAQYARPGARVLVPFGKGAPRAGVIIEAGEAPNAPDADARGPIKALIDVERGEPVLRPDMLRLVFMLRETTFCTYCDAVKAILPKNSRLIPGRGSLRLEAQGGGHLETVYEPEEMAEGAGALSARQSEVLRLLADGAMAMTAAEICGRLGVSRSVIKRLVEKGAAREYRRPKSADIYTPGGMEDEAKAAPLQLTGAQETACREIIAFMEGEESPGVTLLHGVTSSGKTIIYEKLIERAVSRGGGVLVLVPEIALATQMIYRLRLRFGERVGIIHSALSDSERQLQWEAIREGGCDIVVGTRSAALAPVNRLGLVIMDEEQEQAYVSDQTPRYSAREVAAFRARSAGAHLLLASATPSVESYYRAKNAVYNLVALNERYGDMPLPEVKIVDMRGELLAGNSHYISRCLKDEIDARLAAGEQSILLLNRRGYRPLSMCARCGEMVKCRCCDSPLVIHRGPGRYICHYCGGVYEISDVCESCGGGIKHTGTGTQKIEEDLEALFPSARVLRMDLDAVSKKNSVDRLLRDFSRGKYDIIIGTQMIAKGLDFPNVTLAGVLSVDQLLLMPSFRAGERAFAMLTQVVGRSGRGSKRGQAVIQTVDPGSEIIKMAARQDYAEFYRHEIALRKAHLYPPFCELCMVGFASEKEEAADRAAAAFAATMQEVQKGSYGDMPIRILGPAPMRVSYIGGIYRRRVVVKHRPGREFRGFLRRCLSEHSSGPHARAARVYVDFAGEPDN
jgi:primosomal protein N' (replication factor Y)